MKLGFGAWAALFTATAIVVAVAVVAGVVFGRKESTAFEIGLLQAVQIAVISLTGALYSYVFGRGSVEGAARDLVRAHSRPAFRRVLHLYGGLQRLGASIQDRRLVLVDEVDADGRVRFASVQSSLDLLLAEVIDQTATADDAMDDWRDLVPEEVAEVESLARGKTDGH